MYEFHDESAGRRESGSSPKRFNIRISLILVLVIMAVAAFIKLVIFEAQVPPPKLREVVVNIELPPPPPPPKQTPPQEQKLIEAAKPTDAPDGPKPEDERPLTPDEDKASKEDAPAPLGLDAKPDSPGDVFGLVGRPGGRGLLGGGGGGTAEGRYNALMIRELREALETNPRIRTGALKVRIRYWLDSAGRVTRLSLDNSTGDAELDGAIRSVLATVTFSQPPPTSIPMPIVTQVTAQRAG